MPVTFQVVGNLADFGNDPRADVLVRAHATPSIKVGDVAVHSNEPEAVKTDETGAFTLELVSLPGVWYRIHTPYSGAIRTVNLAGYIPDSVDPTAGEAFPDGTVIDLIDVVDEDPTPGYEAIVVGGGVTSHAALTGLTDDDHTQYHTDARGDARYYTQTANDALLAEKQPTGDYATNPALSAAVAGLLSGGDPTRNYAVVAGVMRNGGTPTYWYALDDTIHRCANVETVTTTTTEVLIDFPSLGATKVVSFIVTPDETLAAAGFTAGASVSLTQAAITLTRPRGVSDYVQYNTGTSTWSSFNNVFSGFSFSGGVLTMTHAPIGGSVTQALGVTGRGDFLVSGSAQSGGTADTVTKIEFRDYGGALVAAPTAGMRAYVSRHSYGKVNPQTVDSASYPASNLWFMGIFEVA